MCFAPYPRPLLVRHGGVFSILTPNTCCATAACTFSTSQLPKVVRTCSVFSILTSKCASRHRHVHFWSDTGVFVAFWLPHVLRATTACNFSSLISPNGSAPAALADFSEPTFWLSGSPNIGKFARVHLLSTAFLFSDLFLLPLSSLILPTSAFQSVHIVGSLTSKLPSIRILQLFKDHRWHPHLKTGLQLSTMHQPSMQARFKQSPIDRKKTAIPRGL